jgi:hypothetical protein
MIPYILLNAGFDVTYASLASVAHDTVPDQENVSKTSSVTMRRIMLAIVTLVVLPTVNVSRFACGIVYLCIRYVELAHFKCTTGKIKN